MAHAFGTDTAGQRVFIDLLAQPCHVAIQGMTRSGKSVTCYSILGDLAPDRRVIIAGIDPSTVLLAPWAEYPRPEWRALGLHDLDALVQVLSSLVAEMDARISHLTSGGFTDKISSFTPECPLVVVVLEEFPGLVSALEAEDRALKTAEKRTPLVRGYVRRLIQEGAKVGFRVVLIAQRFDASIIGGAERSNLGTRICHRVDNSDAVRMLVADADTDLVAQIKGLSVGTAYLERVGEQGCFIRSDFTDYSTYAAWVTKNARKDGGHDDPS